MLSLPDQFELFSDIKKEGFLAIKEEKEKGKKLVGIFCSYTPVELVTAAGAYYVSLCGSDQKSVEYGEQVLPKSLCPLIKASYGAASSQTCPYFFFSDAVIGETTCDGKKKMYELLGRIKPVHVMHLPQGKDTALAVESWTEEMKKCARFLEKTLNVTITEQSLHDAIVQRNKIRKLLLNIYEIAARNPSPISGYELASIVESSNFYFKDEDPVDVLQAKYDELLERAEKFETNITPRSSRPRIMITGCPIGGSMEKVVRRIEELGADVVVLDNCSGPRTQMRLVDETIDPYEALARTTLQINCSVMTPNDDRFADMKDEIDKYSVDGVVELILQDCLTFDVEAIRTQEFVQDQLGLPYLTITTDYSDTDEGQLATRLEAFIELLASQF